MRIRTRIIGAALAVVACVFVIFLAYVLKKESDDAHAHLRETIAQAHQLLKVVIAGPLYDGNIEQLNANLDSFFRNPDLLEIDLTEYKGGIHLVRKREPSSRIGRDLEDKVIILRGIDQLGEIRTVYTTANIERRLMTSRNEILFFALVMLTALAVVIYLVARGLTRPIDQLTEAARAIAAGDLERDIKDGGAQEFVILAASFASMRDAIRAKIDDLADKNRQLNQEISERKRTEMVLLESKAKYRALAENIPQRVFYKDLQSRYLALNQPYADDLGVAPGDVIGKDDYAFHPREIAEQYRQDDQTVMKSGLALERDESFVHEGKEFIIHTIKTPVRADDARVIGVCGIYSDVTEQRTLERRLQDSEATLRAIYETAREGILVSSAETGRFVMANPGICRMTGYTEAELSEMTPRDLHPPEVLPRMRRSLEE